MLISIRAQAKRLTLMVCAFQIPHVMQEHLGRYRCEISSSTDRMWTNEADVVIGMFHLEAFVCLF